MTSGLRARRLQLHLCNIVVASALLKSDSIPTKDVTVACHSSRRRLNPPTCYFLLLAAPFSLLKEAGSRANTPL